MIFPHIEVEAITQVNDRIRIDVSKTHLTPDEAEITLVEIEPESGFGFFNVTSIDQLEPENRYLDWEYSTDGIKTISLRVTTDGGPTIITKDISVITEAEDKLFSNDDDLRLIKPDILQWVEPGRNSFNNIHRKAQTEILEWLYKNGYFAADGSKLTKNEVIDVQEVRQWSKYLALWTILEGVSNQPDDVFAMEAVRYRNEMDFWRTKARMLFDLDKDGEQGEYEGYDLGNDIFLKRR